MRLLIAPTLIFTIFSLQTEQSTYFGSQADERLEILEKFLLRLATTTVQIILRIQKQVSQTKTFSTRHPEEIRTQLWYAWLIHNEDLL